MLIEGKTTFEFAREWYRADEIHRKINEPSGFGDSDPPQDVYSREFAEWLAEGYVLAMCKGMDLAERELLSRDT